MRCAAEHGLDYHPVPSGPELALEESGWTELLSAPRNNPLARARALHAVLDPHLPDMGVEVTRPACQGADAVLFNPAMISGHAVAQELGVPSVCITVTPFHPTRAFPHPQLTPDWRLGPVGNRLSYLLAERLGLQGPFKQPLRPRARRRAGFSPVPLVGSSPRWPAFPVLHGCSSVLLPRPTDWPAHVQLSGFWWLDSGPEATLPAAVQEYLDSGPAPIFVGFGGLSTDQRARLPAGTRAILDRLAEVVADGITSSGRRVIVAAGSVPENARSGFSDDVLVVDYVPFDLLFSRVDAVVHRGGVGTVALALRAGRPGLVIPLLFDQFFWAQRTAAIGVGPAPIPADRLTPDAFAAGLAALQRHDFRAAAVRAAERLRAEDGVGNAVAAIERRLGVSAPAVAGR